MSRQPGVWELRFDLTRENNPDDGSVNPYWIKASDTYEVVRGDLDRAGSTRVAIHTVEDGTHIGRDWLGRAVKLIPLGGQDDD